MGIIAVELTPPPPLRGLPHHYGIAAGHPRQMPQGNTSEHRGDMPPSHCQSRPTSRKGAYQGGAW